MKGGYLEVLSSLSRRMFKGCWLTLWWEYCKGDRPLTSGLSSNSELRKQVFWFDSSFSISPGRLSGSVAMNSAWWRVFLRVEKQWEEHNVREGRWGSRQSLDSSPSSVTDSLRGPGQILPFSGPNVPFCTVEDVRLAVLCGLAPCFFLSHTDSGEGLLFFNYSFIEI